MESVLRSKENDCRSCYKCIRNCPTKSISFHNSQASIIPEECVLCGRCFEVCPQECKEIRDDLSSVINILKNKERAIVSLAPSFFSAYPGVSFESMKEALLKVGFLDVEETAVGATNVKKAYEELLKKGDRDILISTACHSVNLLFEKHYPELLSLLAPVMSPMLAHGKSLKERFPGVKVVFIGPCIAKKDEADKNEQIIDEAITFIELDRLFKIFDIEPKEHLSSTSKEESRARLFPLSGGILSSMTEKSPDYTYLFVDGMDECLEAIKEIKEGKIHHTFIEMSACKGSCVNGPAIEKERRTPFYGNLRIRSVSGKKDFVTKKQSVKDLATSFKANALKRHVYTDEEIAQILAKIGKHSKKDELNCSSCGYASCKTKAIAVLEGKATLEMCLPYLMKKAQSFSNTVVESMDSAILVLDEDLNVELSNPSANRLFGVNNKDLLGKNISSLFDSEIFGLALGGTVIHKRKMNLLNSDKIVEISVRYDSLYHIVICLLNDVTKEEKAQLAKERILRKTAEITSEVVDKNMRAVQEIASLLGETTAETKIALNQLKDVLESDKDEK